jgi:hypothetical protein
MKIEVTCDHCGRFSAQAELFRCPDCGNLACDHCVLENGECPCIESEDENEQD